MKYRAENIYRLRKSMGDIESNEVNLDKSSVSPVYFSW